MIRTSQYDDAYTCPSFNCYTSDRLSEITAKVAAESPDDVVAENTGEDFEFAVVREDREFFPDELFDGRRRIGPVFPVFNRDLLPKNDDGLSTSSSANTRLEESIVIPLGKLLTESWEEEEEENGRDGLPSCSSSEADELESIPPETLCVWRPKSAVTPSPSRCKKSNSTGSASKRWKFLDLLRRSNSDGKDSFVFLTPKNREDNNKLVEKSIEAPRKAKGKAVGSAPGLASAHEALYIRNRTKKEGEKKKSYLPYRRDLVGFFR